MIKHAVFMKQKSGSTPSVRGCKYEAEGSVTSIEGESNICTVFL